MYKKHFNSHAHVERDILQDSTSLLISHFNSHAHVERDVQLKQELLNYSSFQLTRSRGA